MSESKRFLVTIMKWRIPGQGYEHLTRFSRLLFFKPTASTVQKIKPVSCFIEVFVTEGLFLYIYFLLFEENHQNRISRAGEKMSPTISLFFVK